jgi:hypothetical protein
MSSLCGHLVISIRFVQTSKLIIILVQTDGSFTAIALFGELLDRKGYVCHKHKERFCSRIPAYVGIIDLCQRQYLWQSSMVCRQLHSLPTFTSLFAWFANSVRLKVLAPWGNPPDRLVPPRTKISSQSNTLLARAYHIWRRPANSTVRTILLPSSFLSPTLHIRHETSSWPRFSPQCRLNELSDVDRSRLHLFQSNPRQISGMVAPIQLFDFGGFRRWVGAVHHSHIFKPAAYEYKSSGLVGQ